MKRKNKGITLVALIVTIIILLILAGITISQLTGSGLFQNTKLAEQKSKDAQEQEDETLKDYENKIGEYITGNRQDNMSIQPTGIKTNTYIGDTCSVTTVYEEKNSMNGLTRSADKKNNISEYLSYSNENGYTVLKSGWYFVILRTNISANSGNGTAADLNISLYINKEEIFKSFSWAFDSTRDENNVTGTIYLNEGDVIYFSGWAHGSTAATRFSSGYCYPMF